MKKLLCLLLLIFCLIGVYASDAFELVDVYESGITDSVFYSYIHKDTGLKVVYENNDAGNNYAELMFRTPMQDEGDLNHVFEHSLLSGSDKYPSSYLFFDFSHRSYLSSVNADTQMSSTAYHAASPSNEQIEIYIDALFSLVDDPDLIHEENIYRREAIRYDLQSVDGPITPAGTVFNEDVGYITDEVRGAVEGVFRALYPGMYASNIIGRLPMHLEDNTYERIKEIFSDYYNWDNALLYAYGDINIDRVLDDIDREYLSVSDKPSTDLSEFYSEEPVPGYRELDCPIPASSDKVVTDSSSYIIYAFDLGDLEFDELLKLDPIIQILTKDGGILDEELEKRSVDGVDVVELDLSTLRPVLEFLLFYTSPEERNGFCEAVDTALSRAASGEISGDEIAGMAGIIKNSILGSTEDGSLSVSNADIYRNLFALTGGIDAIEIYENVLADLEKNGEDIASSIISKVSEEERPRAAVTATPEPGLYEEIIEGINGYLQDMKESMSDGEKAALIEETKAYYDWSSISYHNDDIAISRGSVEDVYLDYDITEKESDGAVIRKSVLPDTNGLVSFSVYFPVGDITGDDMNILALYRMLASNLDTSSTSYADLKMKISRVLISAELGFDVHNSTPYMVLSGLAAEDDLEEAIAVFMEFVSDSVFTAEGIERVVSQDMENYNMQRLAENPSAMLRLADGIWNESSLYDIDLYFTGFYDYLGSVLDSIDHPDYASLLISDLERIQNKVLDKGGVRIEIIGTEKGAEEAEHILSGLVGALPEGSNGNSYEFLDLPSGIAVISNSSTAILYKGISLSGNEGIKGSYLPWFSAYSDEVMLPLRTQGGTYSSGISIKAGNDSIAMYTAMDSSPAVSYSAMDSGWDVMRDALLSESDLNSYALSSLATMNMASSGAIGREESIHELEYLYGKERGEDILNGAKEASLGEKNEVIEALESAFDSNSFIFYAGPEQLLAPIQDEFSLVIDLR